MKAGKLRLSSIDALRGAALVLMALDHARLFAGMPTPPPDKFESAGAALFFTRWVTDFCSPVFLLLAGLSARLRAEDRSPADNARHWIGRGLWLILLEFTLVRWGWMLEFEYHVLFCQVIWAIGASMVALGLLSLARAPAACIGWLGLLLVAGHNLLDGYQPGGPSWVGTAWAFLLRPRVVSVAGQLFFPLYSLLPWFGIFAAGYGLGALWLEPEGARPRKLALLGAAALAGFLALRLSGLYGEPIPWSGQGWPDGLLSLLRCSRVPPSLAYALMTLGPTLLLLAWWEARPARAPRWLVNLGQTSLFYYIAHLYLLHLGAVAIVAIVDGPSVALQFLTHPFSPNRAEGTGLPLWGVYLFWIGSVGALYPLCRAYGSLKRRHPASLLRFL